MISVLFLKFVGRVKNKKIPYFGDGLLTAGLDAVRHLLRCSDWL